MGIIDEHGHSEIWDEIWKTQNDIEEIKAVKEMELEELKGIISELSEYTLKIAQRLNNLERAFRMS